MNAGVFFMTTQKTISRKHVRGSRSGERLSALVAPLLAGLSAGAAVLLALIAMIAYVFSRIDLPLSMMIPLATLSIGAAAFVAAFTFTAVYGRGGLILGALMGLGFKRECVGDILPDEEGAIVFALPATAKLICSQLSEVGRESVSAAITQLSQSICAASGEPVKISVASLRLDAVLAALLHL